MKKVIDWIKSNLAVVISSGVAAVAIVFLVLGLMDDEVPKALEADAPLTRSLTNLSPINESVIIAALTEQEKQQRQLQDILNRIKTSKTYKPLIDTVFPAMTDNDKFSAPYDFRKSFRAKQASFLKDLNAKDRVSSGGTGSRTSSPRRAGRDDFDPRLFGFENRGGIPPAFRGELGDQSGPPSSTEKPQASRDDLIHAQGIYLYASVNDLDSQNNAVKAVNEGTGLLTLEQMWMAQVSLWIQEDIVSVLKRLNEEAAQGLDQDKRWVGYLPIKHLKMFDMDNFYLTSAATSTTGFMPGRSQQEAFVSQRPEGVDTIRFRLTLVMEANSLLRVIEEISQQGFYTLLQPTKIFAVPASAASTGYVYGSAPSVEVEMLWEACFLRAAYEPLMPKVVKDMFTPGTTETSTTPKPIGREPSFKELLDNR